jgi:hypothetical protein
MTKEEIRLECVKMVFLYTKIPLEGWEMATVWERAAVFAWFVEQGDKIHLQAPNEIRGSKK